jgi:hypothetical protein
MPSVNPAGSVRATDTATAQTRPSVTIITNAAKFRLGQIVATPAALALLQHHQRSAASLIARHVHGDWGDTDPEDAALNEMAVEDGSRILSVYRLVDAEKLRATPRSRRSSLPTVWIITDAADDNGVRHCTTLLLPEDY